MARAVREVAQVEITSLPLLRLMRDVYALPRGMGRFRRYLELATGGSGDIELPIMRFNPMAREHVLRRVDALLALGADEIAAGAAREAAEQLSGIPGALRVGLELADDVAGGWTNRYLTDAAHRLWSRGTVRRGFATALLWASEDPDPVRIREEMLAAIYRTVYQSLFGLPRRLGDALRQEGLAGVFAGMDPSRWSAGTSETGLARVRAILAGHLMREDFPAVFACLYGDEAAVEVGYAPLGVPPWGGFAVAVADARDRGVDPVAVLREQRLE